MMKDSYGEPQNLEKKKALHDKDSSAERPQNLEKVLHDKDSSGEHHK